MNLLMKTTVHRHATPPTVTHPAHTLRLGLIVSAVAAVVAVLVEAIVHVPAVVILIPVIVVGFALSWHATGRRDHPEHR
jgi:uncharacterized protein involved in cysteine biosynthesis